VWLICPRLRVQLKFQIQAFLALALGLHPNFLFDLGNGTILHPSGLFAAPQNDFYREALPTASKRTSLSREAQCDANKNVTLNEVQNRADTLSGKESASVKVTVTSVISSH